VDKLHYASLSDFRSMNGHTQSGGHWKAAFRVTSGSDGFGTPGRSSASGDGSAKGILFIIGDASKIVAQRFTRLRHQTGTGKTRGEGPQFLTSLNPKNLLLLLLCVCSTLYIREIKRPVVSSV
jgi:hypothetical protein